PTPPTKSDFNQDGHSDLVWQNAAAGLVSVWFMNGGTRLGVVDGIATKELKASPHPSDWLVVGTGDFNGDGKADIVWQNSAAGICSIWLMDGTTKNNVVDLARHIPAEWRIAAIADFDGDGKPDIVWQNSVSGV